MEIPNSNIYNPIEKRPNIDFSNEHLNVTFSFSKEVVDNLPKVSNEDLKTGNERYCVLLGNFIQQSNNKIHIFFKGVLKADFKEKDLFYTEGFEEVNPNLYVIQKWVKSIQNTISEYNNFNFIGEIHTHPITKENNLDNNIDPCTPSDGDIENIIQEYENGNLSFYKPFIFGIAGRNTSQKDTSFAFYRLVRKNGKYFINQIKKI